LTRSKVGRERRSHPRLSVKVPLKYQLEKDRKIYKTREDLRKTQRHGFTLDLSRSGMNIVVDDPLKEGDILRFDVFLLHKRNLVSVYSEVKWVGPQSAGLYFLMMKPEESEALQEFLECSFLAKH